MLQFIASESQQGTTIHGYSKHLKLKNRVKQLNQLTSPVSVPADSGYSYLLIQVITSGNILTHHLLVVRTHRDEVFQLGRSQESDVVIN